MKYEEIEVGQYYKLCEDDQIILIYILGRDPFNEGRFVASAKEWPENGISHLWDEDFENMEKI